MSLENLKTGLNEEDIKSREAWKNKKGQAQFVDYVEWHTVADILDEHTPTWGFSIKSVNQIGELAVVVCSITIEGVTREGIGTGSASNETGIKKAEHDALKRAAVKFGIARELYKKEEKHFKPNSEGRGNLTPKNLTANNLSELCTAKQVGLIEALAKENGLSGEEACRKFLNVELSVLSKKGASELITKLKESDKSNQPLNTTSNQTDPREKELLDICQKLHYDEANATACLNKFKSLKTNSEKTIALDKMREKLQQFQERFGLQSDSELKKKVMAQPPVTPTGMELKIIQIYEALVEGLSLDEADRHAYVGHRKDKTILYVLHPRDGLTEFWIENKNNRESCNCDDFVKKVTKAKVPNPTFECEHILAVRRFEEYLKALNA